MLDVLLALDRYRTLALARTNIYHSAAQRRLIEGVALMAINVFVSVGRAATPEQEAFVSAIDQLLLDSGFTPCHAQFSSVQPLKKVEEVLATCCGSVIVAFERLFAEGAVELRGGSKEKRLAQLRLPTVWNQVEAALAYSRGHPMLVLCEEGLRSEGLLEKGYDWNVHWISIDRAALATREVRGIFADWAERVKAYQAAPHSKAKMKDVTQMPIAELIGSLTPAQLWAALASLVTVLAGVAAVAYKLGQGL